MKSLGKILLTATVLTIFILPSANAKQVTVKIATFEEAGEDGSIFLDTKGQRYYVFTNGGENIPKYTKYLDEGKTVCLSISSFANDVGYVKSATKGKCKK